MKPSGWTNDSADIITKIRDSQYSHSQGKLATGPEGTTPSEMEISKESGEIVPRWLQGVRYFFRSGERLICANKSLITASISAPGRIAVPK